MADGLRTGEDWNDAELDAIVADYFAMLGDELAGRPYVKSHHRAVLVTTLGRSNGSVEFKHQNISAVLEELGMPWIAGYKPRHNFQTEIFAAVDRYLSRQGGIASDIVAPARVPLDYEGVFVMPPDRKPPAPRPAHLERLARKFDPVERDFRNRALGRAGEEFVVSLERARLEGADRPDLARKVRWVAMEDGDDVGFDVLSFDARGDERLIEVKTTNGAARTPFFLTRNELEVSKARSDAWRIYRVHLFAQTPRVFTIAPPVDATVNLEAANYRATFS